MGTIDLDAARSARAETEQAAHAVRFGGRDFVLPPELPFKVGELWRKGDVSDGLAVLFGEQSEEFFALNPTSPDITELVNGIAALYGIGDAGESPASNGSSPKTSSRSRPTSSGSTAST